MAARAKTIRKADKIMSNILTLPIPRDPAVAECMFALCEYLKEQAVLNELIIQRLDTLEKK